jgi:catalase-peroxidase
MHLIPNKHYLFTNQMNDILHQHDTLKYKSSLRKDFNYREEFKKLDFEAVKTMLKS